MLATKLTKIPDLSNSTEYYRRNKISVKQSKITTQQLKSIESLNILDIKWVTIGHPKTSQKLSKTIRQAEKVSQIGSGKISNTPFIVTQKSAKFLSEKNVKLTKRAYAFKGYASSYSVEMLHSFNFELQIKDTESAIKNKLIDLLTQLKGFNFVTTLVLVFKNIESDDKIKYGNFYSHSKAEIIINESTIYSTIISNI